MAELVSILEARLTSEGAVYEVQTDKEVGKIVPCLGDSDCGTQLIVNAFYAPAKARCSEHGHEQRAATGGSPAADPGSEYPTGPRESLANLLEQAKTSDPDEGQPTFNTELEVEEQTDKDFIKLVPCTGCDRPLIVNRFYAPARALCTECGGGAKVKKASAGSLGVVQAGRTAPEKAANLADCLLNKQFGEAPCPLCQEPMELKRVTHNPNYGPSRIIGYDKATGDPLYKNDTGETVMLQCNHCKTTLGMSTTAQVVYKRQNEPKTAAGGRPAGEWLLPPRDEQPPIPETLFDADVEGDDS